MTQTTTTRQKGGVGQWALAWRRFKKNPAAIAGLIIVGFFAFLAAFDRLVAPYPPNCIPTSFSAFCPGQYAPLQAPSLAHPFGTDSNSYDVYSQVIYGCRAAFYIGFGATAVAMIISVLVGLPAGYFGGRTDNILMRFTEVFLVLPFFLILLLFLKLLHVLIVLTTLQIAASVLIEAGISFLGFGDQTIATWGLEFYFGFNYISDAWWIETFPGIFLTLLVMGFNLLGNGLRDALDPRLRE